MLLCLVRLQGQPKVRRFVAPHLYTEQGQILSIIGLFLFLNLDGINIIDVILGEVENNRAYTRQYIVKFVLFQDFQSRSGSDGGLVLF